MHVHDEYDLFNRMTAIYEAVSTLTTLQDIELGSDAQLELIRTWCAIQLTKWESNFIRATAGAEDPEL